MPSKASADKSPATTNGVCCTACPTDSNRLFHFFCSRWHAHTMSDSITVRSTWSAIGRPRRGCTSLQCTSRLGVASRCGLLRRFAETTYVTATTGRMADTHRCRTLSRTGGIPKKDETGWEMSHDISEKHCFCMVRHHTASIPKNDGETAGSTDRLDRFDSTAATGRHDSPPCGGHATMVDKRQQAGGTSSHFTQPETRP